MDLTLIIVLSVVVVAVLIVALLVVKKRKPQIPSPAKTETPPEVVVEPAISPRPASLNTSLSKTRGFFGKLLQQWKETGGDPSRWEKFEETLLEADVGVATTQYLLNRLKEENSSDLVSKLQEVCIEILDPSKTPFLLDENKKPFVIQIVGVNGVGKTTTIGKLAQYFTSQGKKVLLGAADTFRAAAMSQLKVWAERANTEFVSGREGADPGAVTFDSLSAGKARGMDVVILDTAGRLHTKSNLMEELKKIEKVMKKVIPDAPHETWLVLDGTLGQNSVRQAQEFYKALQITGVIITKLDGTAKGGSLLSISHELKLPVRYVGIGEKAEDFIPFDRKGYVDAILGS